MNTEPISLDNLLSMVLVIERCRYCGVRLLVGPVSKCPNCGGQT